MISRFKDKNEFGGYTWQIKNSSTVRIHIKGTTSSCEYVIEIPEWGWVRWSTKRSLLSNRSLRETVELAFKKEYDFFDSHPDFDVSREMMKREIDSTVRKLQDYQTYIDEIRPREEKHADPTSVGAISSPENKKREHSTHRSEADEFGDDCLFVTGACQANPYKMYRDTMYVMHVDSESIYFLCMFTSDIRDLSACVDDGAVYYERLAHSDVHFLTARNTGGLVAIKDEMLTDLQERDQAIVDYYVRLTEDGESLEAARVLKLGDERGKEGIPFISSEKLNQRDGTGKTVLHRAALSGNNRSVEILVAAGAEVNAVDEDEKTPIHFAASRGHEAVARTLVLCDADFTAKDGVSGGTPLHIAAMFGNTGVCKLLVEAGASTLQTDHTGATPSMYATVAGYQSTAEYLEGV